MKFRCNQIILNADYAQVVGNMYSDPSLPQYSVSLALTVEDALAQFTAGSEYDVVFTAVTPPVE